MAKGALSMLPAEGEAPSISGMLEQFVPQNDSNKWLAYTAGMGAPTRTGALSEALGNTARMQLEENRAHEQLKAAYLPLIANVFETQAKAKQQQELNAMLQQYLGGGPEMSPGAFSAPADELGGGPTMPAGAAPQQRGGGGIANMTPSQVAMLKARGVDLTEMYKWAREPQKLDAGAYNQDRNTGTISYNAKIPEGATTDGAGGVRALPGMDEFTARQTLATETPKSVLGAIGRVNLRANPDGTSSPRSEFEENPVLQKIWQDANGGGKPPARAPAGAAGVAPVAQPRPAGARPLSPMAAQPEDSDRPMILNAELAKAQENLAAAKTDIEKQRATNDINALTREMSASGIKPAVQVAGGASPAAAGLGYGKTTAQATTEELSKGAAGKINDAFIDTSYKPTLESGKAAGDLLVNVEVARQSMRNLGNTGWGTEAKAIGANVLTGLGIAPESAKAFASNAETFQNASMSNLQTTLNAAKGPQTEGDSTRASKTFAQLKNTPQANEFILDLSEAKAQRDQMKAKFYEQALPIARSKGDLQEVDREWSKRAPSVFAMPSMAKWGKK